MKCAVIALMLVAAAVPAAAQDKLADQLRKGIAQEEASQNLAKAIEIYQAIVAQYDQERQTAAAALYRLAECSRKVGKRQQAVAAYERVVREFGDQASTVEQSRRQLAALGAAQPKTAPAEEASTEARVQELKRREQAAYEAARAKVLQRYDAVAEADARVQELKKRGLLAPSAEVPREVAPEHPAAASPEETKLEMAAMEARLVELQAKVKIGQATPSELQQLQIQLRILQQRYEEQLQARQANIELTQSMMKSVESEILLVQEQIKSLEKRSYNGTVSAQSPELLQLRRDLLSLQRQLAELKAGLKR